MLEHPRSFSKSKLSDVNTREIDELSTLTAGGRLTWVRLPEGALRATHRGMALILRNSGAEIELTELPSPEERMTDDIQIVIQGLTPPESSGSRQRSLATLWRDASAVAGQAGGMPFQQ